MKRSKNEKVCPVCGRKFFCPPSDKTTTCSAECRAERARRAINNRFANGWNPDTSHIGEYAKTHKEEVLQHQKLAVEAAKKSPISGRFENNRNSKIWILVDPRGNEYKVRNLLLWARENAELFEKQKNNDKDARRISSGFKAIKRTMEGKRGSPGCNQRGSMHYFGWTLKELPSYPGENENEENEVDND